MDDKNNKKKKTEFTSQDIKLPPNDKHSFIKRLRCRGLGDYKMGTYTSIKKGKTVVNISSILHYNIEECLNSTLKESDKKIINGLL